MIEFTYKHMAIPTVDRPYRGIFDMILREFQKNCQSPDNACRHHESDFLDLHSRPKENRF